jgi:hypothetical protein
MKLSTVILLTLAICGLTAAMALARNQQAGRSTAPAPKLTLRPKLKEMFPQEQVRLCVESTARVAFRRLVWQRRPHQDSKLAVPASNSIRCRLYTAPTQPGWDRVTIRFKNQKRVVADWTITIVPAPANP